MLTQPYVTVESFKAYPTFLALGNLVSGDASPADQDAQLNNMLLTASQWADDFTDETGSLAAHVQTENARLRVARDGRISYHANQGPVSALVGLSIGASPNSLTPLVDLSNIWIEGNAQFVGYPAGAAAPGMSALQFGPPTVTAEMYTQWTYVAGFVSTRLAATVAAGASSFTVTNPVGITAGLVLRLWQPGAEEAVMVAPGYVPGSTTVPIVGVLKYAHNPADGAVEVSTMPSTVRQAVQNYTISMLMRPATGEDPFANSSVQLSITNRDGSRIDGPSMVAEAKRLLGVYGRVR